MLRSLLGRIGIFSALDEAFHRRRQAEHRFRERLQALHEVTLVLAAAGTLEELCRLSVELGRERLGFDRVGIFLLEREPNIVRGTFGTDGEGKTRDERDWHGPARFDALNRILLHGERFVYAPEAPARSTDKGGAACPQALAALWDGKRSIGAISTDNLLTGQPITEDWRELLRLYASVVGHLITRIRAEAALRESEERFRMMADLAPSCIWTATADGSINYANRQWYEFSGLTPEQTAGLEWAQVLHPDDLDRCINAWATAAREGTEYEIEVRNRRKDGVYRWLLTRAVPLRDATGRIQGWFGTSADITDQKEAVEALEEADRRKDEFLALLAHELRNPLAPIRNYVELLRDLPPTDPRFQKAREVIARQVTHQARMLDDLLDVSRIARGKIQLRPERLDLVRLVRDGAEDGRAELENMGLRLVVELPDTPIWVSGDPTRLAQIIGNLVQNAGKFTERGGAVTVRLTLENGRASVTVADTGVGIEPEMLSRVWDVFAQADRSLHRSLGGLGLGLALVKGLAELHGGEVRAASSGPGRGSQFTISLPTVTIAADPSVAPESDMLPSIPLRILIVEDNRDTADSLRDLLQFHGCTVEVAYTGTEGLEAAQRFLPAVVLCDLGLPGLDGFELAAALRRRPELERTLLLAVSGYGGEETRRRARAAGFDDQLVKPIDFDELRRLLMTRSGEPERL
jgi:PAS domain S-box-containing protein